MQPHSSNSIGNETPLQSIQSWKCDPIQQHIPISLFLGSNSPPPPPKRNDTFQSPKTGPKKECKCLVDNENKMVASKLCHPSTPEIAQMVFLKKCHARVILMPNKMDYRQNKTEMDATSRLYTNVCWSLKFESIGKFTALLYVVTEIHVQWSSFSSGYIWTYTRHEKLLWPLFALNIYFYKTHTQKSSPQK